MKQKLSVKYRADGALKASITPVVVQPAVVNAPSVTRRQNPQLAATLTTAEINPNLPNNDLRKETPGGGFSEDNHQNPPENNDTPAEKHPDIPTIGDEEKRKESILGVPKPIFFTGVGVIALLLVIYISTKKK